MSNPNPQPQPEPAWIAPPGQRKNRAPTFRRGVRYALVAVALYAAAAFLSGLLAGSVVGSDIAMLTGLFGLVFAAGAVITWVRALWRWTSTDKAYRR